ncbi:MAG: sorbosone dehydrogenase [Verrucomicrobia bacterium Tous-C9LFEB]|nr:MAG: sorbosone dehydrogenase [Verrucomicrobia bacterium Tous-C9LFEB]
MPRFLLALIGFSLVGAVAEEPLQTGSAAMSDWSADRPGVRRQITVQDLPAPYATESSSNPPKKVARPDKAWPQVPPGFEVTLYAEGFQQPRKMVTAPNGDIFVVDSQANTVRVLRDENGDGKPDKNELYLEGLDQPFGMAFYPPGDDPQFFYVANTGNVVRVPYRRGDLKAAGKPELIVRELSAGGHLTGGGHWTRDLAFSPDGKQLFVSIGSKTNVEDSPVEKNRARIFVFDPDGGNGRTYAHGIRNPVGLAIDPATGALWTSVNERDGLGDNLPCDYITKVRENGFYGWPWFYLGNHEDPRHKGKYPELANSVIVPDVLLQSHSASLCLTFYEGTTFPARYRGQIFAGLHGSWNRSRRTGYKVVMVSVKNGSAAGEYEDFLTGFVTTDGNVWGRPVGVTTAKDGALLVSDDGGKVIWRVQAKAEKKN